jgi:hypothetical protein
VRAIVFAILTILVFPSFSWAQAPTPIAIASTDQKRVQLSESVRAVVVIVAPAPLRVEPPKQLLAPESDRDWKILAVGPATLMPLFGFVGWECWVQTYRLDPYVIGNALQVECAPIKVNGRVVTPSGFEVTVLSTVTETKADAARPVTAIEQLPPPTIVEGSSSMWWVLAGVAIVAVGIVVWRLRHRPQPVPPCEWAIAALDRLEREGVSSAALADGVATVVRGFIDRRFGIPAPKLTTTELLIAAEQAAWPVEETDPLRRLLEICDRAKFAGDVPDDDGCRNLLAGGRDWINRVGSDPRPG